MLFLGVKPKVSHKWFRKTICSVDIIYCISPLRYPIANNLPSAVYPVLLPVSPAIRGTWSTRIGTLGAHVLYRLMTFFISISPLS